MSMDNFAIEWGANMENKYQDDIVFARFLNYMNKSLLNKKIDYIRKNNKINQKEELDTLPNYGKSTSNFSFFDDLNISENIDLSRSIYSLSKVQRKVIIEFYLKNKSFENIAKELNSNVKAIRQIKYRALNKLKKVLRGNF